MPIADIVLPVYRPLPGWENLVHQRFTSLAKKVPELNFRLILVNDGTKEDEILPAVKRLTGHLPDTRYITYDNNCGKGYALRRGIEAAEGDFILYTDIDWPYTEESVVAVIRRLTEDAEVVIGIRNEQYYRQLPAERRRISKWLRAINRKLLKLKVNDTQAGLKGFRRYIKPVFMKTTIDRYLFDLEFVYLLSKMKDLKITTIPVQLRDNIIFSKMNKKILLQESLNFLKVWLA